jgi:hypothetical protein
VRAEQVALRKTELAPQSIDKIRLALQPAVGENVLNGYSEGGKMPGNQNGAVAFQRLFFRAHQGEAILLHSLLDAIKAVPKQLSPGDTVILNTAVLVAGWIFAACAEFPAEKNIIDAGLTKLLLEVFPIELRIYAAAGF